MQQTVSGGFSPDLLSRGSALGPRWGHGPRPPISPNVCYFLHRPRVPG